MLGSGFVQRTFSQESLAFIQGLEAKLQLLPNEIQDKLKKLNFMSNCYDFADTPHSKQNLKAATIELLDYFIKQGYQPIFVGEHIGYFLIPGEDTPLERLTVFKELCEQNSEPSKPLTPAFQSTKLNACARPFVPSAQPANQQDHIINSLTCSG
jgi:hypothetical protein